MYFQLLARQLQSAVVQRLAHSASHVQVHGPFSTASPGTTPCSTEMATAKNIKTMKL